VAKTDKKIIGLAGLGYWGRNIFRNLFEMGVLHSACDAEISTLKEFENNYPDLHYTTSFDDLLSNPEIKAIALATPAVTHFNLVKKSLRAGKDVYVEKPLALEVREGKELVELAGTKNRVLMVGHILQYHPVFVKLKELISAGELGRIEYIYSNRLNIGKLRTEENVLWSFAPHDISMILGLLDEEPLTVTAMGGDYLSKGIADSTMTMLEFRNGVKSHIFVSWLHPFKEQKLTIVGSKAMAVFDDISQEKLFIYPHRIEWKDGKIPVAQKAEYTVVPVEKGEPLRLELSHFIDCVENRNAPRTDGHEGLRVLKVLDAAEKSLHNRPSDSVNRPDLAADAFIHESAVVDELVQIGERTRIWHFSHVLGNSIIGADCTIGQNVVIGPDVTIGSGCKIQNNVSVYRGVVLENDVFCGPSCVFTNVYNPRAFIDRKDEFLQTIVKKGATIGANATVVCGTTIGRFAMIGAGAVVKCDVDDYAIVAGVPAKQIGWACECGSTLIPENKHMRCGRCGKVFELDGTVLKSIKKKRK